MYNRYAVYRASLNVTDGQVNYFQQVVLLYVNLIILTTIISGYHARRTIYNRKEPACKLKLSDQKVCGHVSYITALIAWAFPYSQLYSYSYMAAIHI